MWRRRVRGLYFQKPNGHYHVYTIGVMKSVGEGTYMVYISEEGETLEETKKKLKARAEKECVPEFEIGKWVEARRCPNWTGHHVGSTCTYCGMKD